MITIKDKVDSIFSRSKVNPERFAVISWLTYTQRWSVRFYKTYEEASARFSAWVNLTHKAPTVVYDRAESKVLVQRGPDIDYLHALTMAALERDNE